MPKPWVVGATAAMVAAAAGSCVVASAGGKAPTSAAQESPPNTATVEEGRLSARVSLDGILTHRARADGSPYVAINRARGTYTALPESGDKVPCGGVLYRVDDIPVLLLCGSVPAYRDLHTSDAGADVRQLNRNLHELGYDADAGVHLDPGDRAFTPRTEQALEVLQHDKGYAVTGSLDIDDALFLPEPVRIVQVTGKLGEPARPGGQVAQATSDNLEVLVSLDPSQRTEVRKGDRAQITLPDNTSASGTVERIGRVVLVPAGQSGSARDATIPVHISLDHPERVRGLDQAPARVEVTTRGVDSALNVPVTAILGKSGGGYAVEVVRNEKRQLVAVKLGLFDTTAGRVQVDGDLREGDQVVVPSP